PLAQFVTDVTIPDGTTMLPGQTFNKKWRLRNIGACAWNGYSLVFDSGESMNGPATKAIAAVNPGQEIDIDVDLKAPTTPGTYRGYWRLVTNGNVLVPIVSGYQGRAFYVEIKVAAPTNTPAPIFAVTSVSFANVGGCGGFTTTANITTNGAGTVKVKWIRSDGATPPVPPDLVFAAAGTQSVSISWTTTASGTHWFDLYVDSPNNQQFGRAQFTCP
ncbi:MAG: NBR1-Ig-like domain-containing protein, partial [Anaerolineales bacterium]